MIGLLFLLCYLAAGVLMLRFLLPRQPVVARVWLGLGLGIFLMMAAGAGGLFRPFDALGQGISLVLLVVSVALCF